MGGEEHSHPRELVFTAPGEYLLKVTASAELSDGSTVSDTRYLKFAVGDSASADALYAMEAQARGSSGSASSGSASSTSQASGSSSAAAASDQSGYKAEFTVPWGAIAAGVAAVIAVGAFLSFRRAPPHSVRLWMKCAVTVRERVGNSRY